MKGQAGTFCDDGNADVMGVEFLMRACIYLTRLIEL